MKIDHLKCSEIQIQIQLKHLTSHPLNPEFPSKLSPEGAFSAQAESAAQSKD